MPVKNGMKVLSVLMILMNSSGIVYILGGLENASALSAILGIGNVLVSGYVIWLLGSWLFGASPYKPENIKDTLEWGLTINVAETLLQVIVFAIFVSQNREAFAQNSKTAALESCQYGQ